MSLELDLRLALGDFSLDVAFAGTGRLTVLFGPSGSGKTSLIGLIAGLRRPDDGRIAIDGRVLVDTATDVFVPPHRRRIGYVFQDGRLFPHLSVRRNLEYGTWFSPRKSPNQKLSEIVELLGIGHLLHRYPSSLSGGEKQRVAIGRALMASPDLLLMDEPLAALDERRKSEVLPYIERLRDVSRVPIVYVSHSIAEVRRLASTLVVLDAGRVVAVGPADAVLRRLDLFPLASESEDGTDLDTRIAGHDEAYGLTQLSSAAGMLQVPRIEGAVGTPVRLRIRAREVMVALEPPQALSALNVLPATIRAAMLSGASGMELRLDCGGVELAASVTRLSFETLGLNVGKPVYAVIKSVSFERGVKVIAPRANGLI